MEQQELETPTGAPDGAPTATQPMGVRERVSQLIAQAKATLTPDGTAMRVEAPEPGEPELEPGEFPEVEPVAGEAAPEPEPEPEPAPEPTPDERTVVLGEHKITFRAPEEAELIRGLQRQAAVGEQLQAEREAFRAQEDELNQFQDLLEIDRSGVVAGMLPPDAKKELLVQLLLEEGVMDDAEFMERLDAWRSDTAERRAARLEIENARFKARQELNARYEAKRALRQTATTTLDVAETLARQLIPDRQLQENFIDDMVAEVRSWASAMQQRQGNVPALNREQLLQITARRLAVYRISPDDAKRALDPATATPPRARPSGPEAERIAAQAQKARETGARFQQGANGRKVAALIPGSGAAGTPGDQGAQPPKGQNYKDRSSWLRERLGLPKR